MKLLWTLLLGAALSACGIDGAPVSPGSGQDPNIADGPVDVDPFFE